MADLEKTSKIWSPKPVEFGDSEAAKLCAILHDCKESVEDSLQQIIKTKILKHGKFKDQDVNCVRLGPCFKPERVGEILKSLKECFPVDFTKGPFLNEPEKLKCDWVKSSGKPVNGWTSTIDTRQWFERLSSRHNQWKKLRIYEFLKLSTYPNLPFYGALTLGLLCCWNPCLNVFITGQGFKTVTLEDVAFLTGLSPTGVDLPTQVLIDGALDMEKIKPWKSTTNMSFSSIVDFYNSDRNKSLSAEISRKEEVLFINVALCKLMMFPSCNVNKTFLKLAANIEASGLDPRRTKPLGLAPLFLGQVYRCLYRLRTNAKLSRSGGPIWVVSMWGLFYFPRLVELKDDEMLKNNVNNQTVLPVNDCCCYGELAIHTSSPVRNLSFEEVLRGLLFPREANQYNWHPFFVEEKADIRSKLKLRKDPLLAATPSWLLKISSMVIREGDQLHWSSILLSRDLICLEPQVIGVEPYNPNLVARQFGMTQGLGIPYYKTLNRPWGTRPNLLDMAMKSTENKFAFTESWLKAAPTYEVRSFQIAPWFRWAEIDPAYEIWWIDFLKRCQPTWLEAFAILVRNIQGHLIISSPSPSPPLVSLSAWQNKQSRGARIPADPSQLKVSGQFEKFAQRSTALRVQKRKIENVLGLAANSTFSPLKKAIVEDSIECDDNTPLKVLKRRHSTHSCQPSLIVTLRRQKKSSLDLLLKDNSQPVVSGNPKNIEQDVPGVLSTTSVNPRRIDIKEKKTSQNIEPDIYNVSLNVLKILEKEVVKEVATTPKSTEVLPENLTNIITEEITFEAVGSEPEDSLEPPHEMVRGMGSSNLNDTSFPSMEPNNATLQPQGVDHISLFPLQVDKQPSIQEPLGDSGSSDAITSDISQAIVDYSSTSSEMLESFGQPRSPLGLTYTPEKALAEVNSLVCLIEDTLRPTSNPSSFDMEKANAEKILNTLQSNIENLASYTELTDQICRLTMVSPPKFQPNLAHFQTIFSSLQDQLRDIHKHADRLNYNPCTLQDLETVARDLRDRIKNSRERIDKLQVECDKYDEEIEDLEVKLANLKQLRASKQQELSTEQQKFNDFSSTWAVTIPSLQNQAKIMVTAKQTKAEWESTLKAVKANVHSFLELLRTM